MSGFFQYQVDRDTEQSCLDLVHRAYERLRAGKPLCADQKIRRKASGQTPGCKRRGGVRSAETIRAAGEVIKLRNSGVSYREIACRLGLSVTRVAYLVSTERRMAQ